MKRNEIHIRDPFVLLHQDIYYLYGTTDTNTWSGNGTGFDFYTSKDLQSFDGPFPAFRPQCNFWGKTNFWAPEVWTYRNSFYMAASFKAPNTCRGVQILKADSPAGPFCSVGSEPITPKDWECLDGTFYLDSDGKPYLIFSHEWLQITDGAICAIQLSEDLSHPLEAPQVLFHASQAFWAIENSDFGHKGYVTDGPFLYQNRKGNLVMIWSSFCENGYAIGQSYSQNGLFGKWIHQNTPIFDRDGGHGMLFRNKGGELLLSIHTPNKTGNEKPVFIPMKEENGLLVRD